MKVERGGPKKKKKTYARNDKMEEKRRNKESEQEQQKKLIRTNRIQEVNSLKICNGTVTIMSNWKFLKELHVLIRAIPKT